MIIRIKVKPSAKRNFLEKTGEEEYLAEVTERAVNGKANLALVKLITKEFGVSARQVKIKTPRNRNKIVEILSKYNNGLQ